MILSGKVWSLLAAAALCAVVAFSGGGRVAAEWPPGVVIDEDFMLNVAVLQEPQVIQIGLLSGPTPGNAFVHFEIAAEDPITGLLMTNDSTLMVATNGQGIGFLWSQLSTVCAIGGDFTANITAFFFDPVTTQLKAAKTYCRFSGQYLSDINEIAGLDPQAFLEVIGATTAPLPSSPTPGTFLYITNGWTSTPGNTAAGGGTYNGPGVWVRSVVQTVGPSGPEGVLSGN